MNAPCCMSSFGDTPDRAMVAMSSLRLGQFGDACSDAKANQETFQRLSQKTDKSAQTRANAASNAAYWGQEYQNCLNKKAIDEIATVQQQVTQSTQTANAPAGSPGVVSEPLNWNTVILYGGVAIGASLLLYALFRRKSA